MTLKIDRIIQSRLVVVLAAGLLNLGVILLIVNYIFSNKPKEDNIQNVLPNKVTSRFRKKSNEAEAEIQAINKRLTLANTQGAIDSLDKLILKEPKNWIWKTIRVEIARRAGLINFASSEINQLVSLHPKNIHIIKLKVLIDLDLGEEDSAIAFLKAKLNSGSKDTRIPISLLLADLYQEIGNKKAAKNIYQSLAKEEPNNPTPLLALAIINGQQENYTRAKQLLEKARILTLEDKSDDQLIDRLSIYWSLKSKQIMY